MSSSWSWCVDSSCFSGIVSWACEREQTWSFCECLAKPLESACVESEGSVVLLVRLTILGLVSCAQVTWSTLLCCPLWVALASSWCPWCRGEQDYHRICCVCRGLPQVRVASCLSRVNIRVKTKSYVGSWTAPRTTAFACLEHSTCGCLVRVL